MFTLWRDAQMGARVLRRNPGFAGAAAVTFALGIAATTAIFSVVYATFLAPLPYREADRLVVVWSKTAGERTPTTPADFMAWRSETTAFEALNASTVRAVNVATPARPELVQASPVTPGFLAMLGYGHPLALGRDFLDEEATAGRDQVVILSHRLWRERFAGDPAVVGRAVRIDGKPHVVVGVLGRGPADLNESQLWLPLSFSPELLDPRTSPPLLTVLGRLKRDVGIEQAGASLAALGRRLVEAYPDSHAGWSVSVEPFRNDFVSARTKRGLWLLLGAVAMVLLIACANVASLLLARGAARTRELVVRTALGASRARIARQLITEALLLAAAGGVLGIALAWALLRVVIALMPASTLPTEADVRLNLPVLVFSAALCAVAGVLSGSAPAWQAACANLDEMLKQSAPSVAAGGRRLRRALVAIEFALALTLLTGGAFAVQGLAALARVELGFTPANVLTFTLPMPADDPAAPDRMEVLQAQLLERVRQLPGVLSASASAVLPMHSGGLLLPFSVVGRPLPENAPPAFARCNAVGPRFFETLGIRVVRGRAISARDTAGAPRVAMVNETFARRHLSHADPLAERVMLPIRSPEPRLVFGPHQVVGVFADVRQDGPSAGASEEVVIPFSQTPFSWTRIALRTRGDPGATRRDVEAIVRSLDPELPIADVKTMESRVAQAVAGDRFHTVLFAAFAVIGVLLAGFGVYAVTSFAVAQRTREIGLRMALGAGRGRVLGEVLREGVGTALGGAALGAAGAWFAARTVRSLVHGVESLHPGPFILVTLALLCTALVACLVPAARAASVQPAVALRHD